MTAYECASCLNDYAGPDCHCRNPVKRLKGAHQRMGWFEHSEDISSDPTSPWDVQVGGSHYKDMAIQPSEYIVKNGLGWFEGNVIKYISRFRAKNGIKDLEKARHYLDLLIEAESVDR